MSTLIHRVAAIQVEMLHIQFRKKKIFEDQKRLATKDNSNISPRESLKVNYGAVYNTIDMIITFEHLYQLFNQIFATPELKDNFDEDLVKILGDARKTAQKWVSVRNKIGGHIDIEVAEAFCKQNNYKGVFLSDDLEADVTVLNMLLIFSAINEVKDKNKLFERDLDLKKYGINNEMKMFVEKLNEDWELVFSYFKPMMEFLYKLGKKEKLLATIPSERNGVVVD